MTELTANYCFGCGNANTIGLHLNFEIDTSDPGNVRARTPVQLSRLYEGGSGNIHGGIIATLMDEAMSKLNKPLGLFAVTRQLEVEYLRPSPIETTLLLESRHLRREGRKLFHVAELLDAQGRVLASAKGLFVVVEPSNTAPPVQSSAK